MHAMTHKTVVGSKPVVSGRVNPKEVEGALLHIFFRDTVRKQDGILLAHTFRRTKLITHLRHEKNTA